MVADDVTFIRVILFHSRVIRLTDLIVSSKLDRVCGDGFAFY